MLCSRHHHHHHHGVMAPFGPLPGFDNDIVLMATKLFKQAQMKVYIYFFA
jgi:hypothetical protein